MDLKQYLTWALGIGFTCSSLLMPQPGEAGRLFARGANGAEGATSTIDTQNKGDYNVDWQKGQKPVVTQEQP